VTVTLDASVWLASVLAGEPAHQASVETITEAQRARHRLLQPPLFLVEVSAALARRTGAPARGLDALRAVLALPRLEIAEWTPALNASAATLAAERLLRAGDACYLATAASANATLVTLDLELQARGATTCPILTPDEWLAEPRGRRPGDR
jgi:predicted nucleic acid-binding protein